MLSFKQNTDAFKQQIDQYLTPSFSDTVKLLEADAQSKTTKIEASIRIFRYIRMTYPAQKLFPREQIKFVFNDSTCQITAIGNYSLSLLSQIIEAFTHKLLLRRKKKERRIKKEKQASRELRKAIVEEAREFLEEEISKMFPGEFKLVVNLREGFFFLTLKRADEIIPFAGKNFIDVLRDEGIEGKIRLGANMRTLKYQGETKIGISYLPIRIEGKVDKEELLEAVRKSLS